MPSNKLRTMFSILRMCEEKGEKWYVSTSLTNKNILFPIIRYDSLRSKSVVQNIVLNTFIQNV